MFENPSLTTRIVIGKTIGLIFGLIGILIIPTLFPEMSTMMKWAFVLWYILVGAFVGIAGTLTYHPVLKINLRWWFRGPLIGGSMDFILALFLYGELTEMMTRIPWFSSPFWIVAEGVIVGAVIDYFCTRYGGEGADCVQPVHG
jgi:hypothetical protein